MILSGGPGGIVGQQLMDDEILTDADGYFTIVLSYCESGTTPRSTPFPAPDDSSASASVRLE